MFRAECKSCYGSRIDILKGSEFSLHAGPYEYNKRNLTDVQKDEKPSNPKPLSRTTSKTGAFVRLKPYKPYVPKYQSLRPTAPTIQPYLLGKTVMRRPELTSTIPHKLSLAYIPV